MKSREEVVEFIGLQISDCSDNRPTAREKGGNAHYGKQELRELMDFIYGSSPTKVKQELNMDTFNNN